MSFATGYLAVWGASGGVAFLLAWSLGELVMLNNATVAKLVAAMTFAMCGIYQLSSLKYRCLAKCRSVFSAPGICVVAWTATFGSEHTTGPTVWDVVGR